MKMTMEREELLKEGYRIFADAVNYSDDEVVGYARLAKAILCVMSSDAKIDCEDRNILISQLIKAMNSKLSEKQQHVLTLRFGLNGHNPLTLKEIGEFFQLTVERIRQIEAASLRRLRQEHCKDIFTISRIQKNKETPFTYIEDVGFSVRTINCLKRAGIDTVEELLYFLDQQLFKIVGLGSKGLEEVLQKKQELLEKNAKALEITPQSSIRYAIFNTSTSYCLRRAGINTIEELINFPEDELGKIISSKRLEEVLQKKQELLEKFS